MMRRFIPAAMMALSAMPLMTTPLVAQERMTRTICQEAFQRAADMTHPNDANVGLQVNLVRVTPDGWCQFRGSDPGFEGLQFDTIDWRVEGSSRWTRDGIPPLAVHVRIAGFSPAETRSNMPGGAPLLDIEATLRQDPDAGLVILERAVMSNDAGDILSVSGVFERVFLSSTSMMQVSMGSATFKAGLMSMTLEGTHENPFGFYLDVDVQGDPAAQRDAAFDAISRLPEGLMDDATRAELMAFSGDLPKPIGTLEVNVASERGLGMMQVGMSMYAGLSTIMDEGVMSNEMEILFDGLTVDANWTPKAQVAD